MEQSVVKELFPLITKSGIMEPYEPEGEPNSWFMEEHESLPQYCYLVVRDFVSINTIKKLEQIVEVKGFDFVNNDGVGKIILGEKR